MSIENQKETPVIFQGKASEYFGIWIVNLLLSLLTLGIYSAWAKIRRKKYFYNNTLIENVGFDYHAKPMSILKGRLIAFAFFAIASINPILQSLMFFILFLAVPWLVVRGSLFNARNTSHRGLRFDFIGTVGEAVKVFIGLPLLTMITFGMAAPFVAQRRSKFLMDKHLFGKTPFEMNAKVNEFYMVYIKLLIVPSLIFGLLGIIAAIAIPMYQKSITDSAKTSQMAVPYVQALVSVNANKMANNPIILAANDITYKSPPKTDETTLTPEEEAAIADATAGADLAEDAAVNAAESAPAEENAALSAEQPDADQLDEDMATEELEPEAVLTPEEQAAQDAELKKIEDAMKAEEQIDKMKDMFKGPGAMAAVFGLMAGYLLFIFGFVSYLQARLGNLIWNNTKLDKLTFKSTLRARDFLWLYFSNIVAIMLTFGLATPWAQIRMARYRASKLSIIGDVDFDQFVGDKKDEIKATGEEIADMFDVDLSFG
jgi:uncharacterized membrane protein YjgN (DUF898 family)